MADSLLPIPSAMTQDGASWGPVVCSYCSQWLQELNQQQWAPETHQLLRWKEAELCEAQELLQRQLAKEMVRPSRSCRAACSKLQDVLKKLCWETDGYQPARICHLQNELQLERRRFIKYNLEELEGELPTSPCKSQSKGPPGNPGHQEMQSSCYPDEMGPRPWQQPAARSSLGLSSWHYRRDPPKATELSCRQHARLWQMLCSRCQNLQEKTWCFLVAHAAGCWSRTPACSVPWKPGAATRCP